MNNQNMSIISSLQFEGYKVNHLYFEENNDCTTTKCNICPEFKHQINQISDKDFEVVLGCRIISTEENPFPFSTEVIITGNFSIDSDAEDKEVLLNENSVAILFPYLRSTLSMLVLNANHKPLVLPTLNIVEVLKRATEEENK